MNEIIKGIKHDSLMNNHWAVETNGGYMYGKSVPGRPLMEAEEEAEQMLKEWVIAYDANSDSNKSIRVNPHEASVCFIHEGDGYHQTNVVYIHGVNDGHHGSKRDYTNRKYLRNGETYSSLSETNPLTSQLLEIVDRIYPLTK